MLFGVIFPIGTLISGIVVLTISSDKAVEHTVYFASALGVSSIMIGLVLVAIGTDLPELLIRSFPVGADTETLIWEIP